MKAKSGFVLRQVGEMTVVVPLGERVVDFNGLVTLNDTGRFLWGLLDGTHSAEDMVRELVRQFEVDEAQAERDLQAFLTELETIGLVENAS